MKSIANQVISQYQGLLATGKPTKPEEYTVLAAIVAKIHNKQPELPADYRILSLATGTKCIGENLVDENGYLIRDSHAEVLARRGLQRLLLQNALYLIKKKQMKAKKPQQDIIEKGEEEQEQEEKEDEKLLPLRWNHTPSSSSFSTPFSLKSHWQIFLYVSDSPCGDASIYPTKKGDIKYTGAKLTPHTSHSHLLLLDNVEEGEEEDDEERQRPLEDGIKSCSSSSRKMNQRRKLTRRDENGLLIELDEQILGEVRTKSTRSSVIAPTNSMSCSDKICRWHHLGLQGSRLYDIVGRIPLSGVIIGADPNTTLEHQFSAAQRALVDRCAGLSAHSQQPLLLEIIEEPFFSNSISNVTHHFQGQDDGGVEEEAKGEEQGQGQGGCHQCNRDERVEIGRGGDGDGGSHKRAHEHSTLEQSRKKQKKITPLPCGHSINWQLSIPEVNEADLLPTIHTKLRPVQRGTQEVTIAHTGLPQGANLDKLILRKGKVCCSRLSPYAFQQLFQIYQSKFHEKVVVEVDVIKEHSDQKVSSLSEEDKIKDLIEHLNKNGYQDWRENFVSKSLEYLLQVEEFFQHSVFKGWIRSKRLKPLETEEK